MRAVALSDKTVQDLIAKHFIPLKVEIPYGTQTFPLDWPGLKMWQDTYVRMGGPKTTGITACSVLGPEVEVQYGCTGSAFVWELFDSIAYDADKFARMLKSSLERYEGAESIKKDTSLNKSEKELALRRYNRKVRRTVASEGPFRLPPEGFRVKGAKELFRMTGDLTDQPPRSSGTPTKK